MYFNSNRFFSDKITILSYKTLFGPAFSLISENLVEQFFLKFQKTVILGQNGNFWHIWAKSAKMRIFIKNRAVLFFYPYCPPTSCRVSEKSVERFPRSIRQIRTSEHTYIRTKVISQNRSLSLVQLYMLLSILNIVEKYHFLELIQGKYIFF